MCLHGLHHKNYCTPTNDNILYTVLGLVFAINILIRVPI